MKQASNAAGGTACVVCPLRKPSKAETNTRATKGSMKTLPRSGWSYKYTNMRRKCSPLHSKSTLEQLVAADPNYTGKVKHDTGTPDLFPVPPRTADHDLETGCLSVTGKPQENADSGLFHMSCMPQTCPPSSQKKSHNSVLSHDPPSFVLINGQALTHVQTTEPLKQSKDLNRRRRFMSSIKGVSHPSRRAKRRLCCKLQLWMWRKWRRAKCRFWIFKAKKRERGACLISSSPCPGLKTQSQTHKGKVQKHRPQSLEKLQERKSPLAVGCDTQGGSEDRLDKDSCLQKLCEPTGLSDICTTTNLLQNLVTVTDVGVGTTHRNMPTTTVPSQRHGKGSDICVGITDKHIPKKTLPSQRHGGQNLYELVGPSEQCTAVTPLQDQATNRDTVESFASKKMQSQHQTDVSHKALTTHIHEFLNDFYRIYGSFIPLQKSDVLRHLKRKFNMDFTDRINAVFSEVTKYQAAMVQRPVPSFRVVYKKHMLTLDDLSTLADQNWLNDQVMNMYGELITESAHHKVHFLNSFFHRQLVTKGYEGVKRWTKQVDLFSKSLLLVPIHLEVHWCLVTADTVKKRICLYDSQGNMLQKVARNILKYLMTEARERQQTAFQNGWTVSCDEGIPQQTNENDCGVFVLEYCRCLALAKPLHFSQKDIPRIRKRIYKELCDCELHE
uniref:uncharacterized protein isoform X1 n=1 Tax=Centroberyx gerrardi TaxID=166262 RepID=UPI003AAB3E09